MNVNKHSVEKKRKNLKPGFSNNNENSGISSKYFERLNFH